MARKSLSKAANSEELNLTSLIDAVFLLLIFFMVTTVFVKATKLKVELPPAVHYDKLDQEKKLNIRISSDGEIEINSQLVRIEQLPTMIRMEKTRTGSSTLIITADGDVPHGIVIDAMEAGLSAGVEKIDIETEEPDA